MGYPVCPNRIHSSGINGPRKSVFEITKSFLGDGHKFTNISGYERYLDFRLYNNKVTALRVSPRSMVSNLNDYTFK